MVSKFSRLNAEIINFLVYFCIDFWFLKWQQPIPVL